MTGRRQNIARVTTRRLLRVICAFGVFVVALCAMCPSVGRAADAASLEYPIKATFLMKFGDFVQWPENAFHGPNDTFNICLLGADPFGSKIDQTARGQTVNGHAIAVQRLTASAATDRCHVLFVGATAQPSAADILRDVKGRPVLTVTDDRTWSGPSRGMIHFIVQDNRVRFLIDDTAATESGLVMSSKLLAIAAGVTSRRKEGSP